MAKANGNGSNGNGNGSKKTAKHLQPYHWKKGQSGNPSGRPPKLNLTARLQKALAAGDGKQANALIRKVVELAVGGERWAVELCFDRIEGKALERIAASVTNTRLRWPWEQDEDDAPAAIDPGAGNGRA